VVGANNSYTTVASWSPSPALTEALYVRFRLYCPYGTTEWIGIYNVRITGLGFISAPNQNIGGAVTANNGIVTIAGELDLDGALNHDGATVGLYGVTPVVKGAALTEQLTTVTCSAPGTPDYAIADPVQNAGFGFSTSNEMLSLLKVVANLQTRLAEVDARLGSPSGIGVF
jgi:hypothetical protein